MSANQRQPKAEMQQTERRRRKTGGSNGSKLAIPESIKEKYPDVEFRWGRDDGGRMEQLTVNDDWDKVPDVKPIHAGTAKSGDAIQQHLLMKKKVFMNEDRAAKARRIDDSVKAQMANPEKQQAIAQGGEQYAVEGNQIT